MQNKLSVVHVIDILNAGGAERVLVTLSNILHGHGHKVKVITTVKPGPLAAQLQAGIEFESLDRKWKWNPLTMYKLIMAVQKYDVIHIHSRHNLRYFLLAKNIFGLKKKVFYHEHHGYRAKTKATLLEKKLFSSTNFIAVSESLKQWAIKEAGTDQSNTFILPNIVLKENVPDIEKQNQNISLVIVSNFVPVKNIEFAIDLLHALHKQSERFSLTIIGAVSNEEYYRKIISIIDDKGLSQNVVIKRDCMNVQPLLPQFDLAIHTSKSESGPLVLIEYIAQSLPFITYRTGEVAKQLQKDIPAFIMQSFNVQHWLFQINKVLQSDQKKLKDQLQEIFERSYSAQVYYEKCISIYKKGLGI